MAKQSESDTLTDSELAWLRAEEIAAITQDLAAWQREGYEDAVFLYGTAVADSVWQLEVPPEYTDDWTYPEDWPAVPSFPPPPDQVRGISSGPGLAAMGGQDSPDRRDATDAPANANPADDRAVLEAFEVSNSTEVHDAPTTWDAADPEVPPTDVRIGSDPPVPFAPQPSMGEQLCAQRPGGMLATLLDQIDETELSSGDRLDVIAGWEKLSAWAAMKARLSAARLTEDPTLQLPIRVVSAFRTQSSTAAEEVAMRMGWSKARGREFTRAAGRFDTDLTPTADAVLAGSIDMAKAESIASALRDHDHRVSLPVQQRILPRAGNRPHHLIRRDLATAIAEVDPEDYAERCRRATRRRCVGRPRSLGEGMASIFAIMPAVDAAALNATLDAAARAARADGDERTIDQLRSDVLATLSHAMLAAGIVGPEALSSGADLGDRVTDDTGRPDHSTSTRPDVIRREPAGSMITPPDTKAWAGCGSVAGRMLSRGEPSRAGGFTWRPPGGVPHDLDTAPTGSHTFIPPSAPPLLTWHLSSPDVSSAAHLLPWRPLPDALVHALLTRPRRPAKPCPDRSFDASSAPQVGPHPPAGGTTSVGVHPGTAARSGAPGPLGPNPAGRAEGRAQPCPVPLAVAPARLIFLPDCQRPAPRGTLAASGSQHPVPSTRDDSSRAPAGTPSADASDSVGAACDPVRSEDDPGTTMTVSGTPRPGLSRLPARRFRLGTIAGRPAQVNVTVPLSTLLGGDQPGELPGLGPVPAEVARALAAGGTWTRLITDPVSGTVLDVGRRRYTPPADMADHVRSRNPMCVAPGCTHPAASCQLDHTVPAPDGPTAASNLAPLCTRHHLLKTHARYRLNQPTPGIAEWRTPTGKRYRRLPDGTTVRLDRTGQPINEPETCIVLPAPDPGEPPF